MKSVTVRCVTTHAILALALAGAAMAASSALVAPLQPEQPAEAEQPMTIAKAEALWEAEEWEAAAKAFEELLEREPEHPGFAFRAAFAWHSAGMLDKAIPAHKRAAEFEQVRATALYNLGCAYALQGRSDAAFDALREAREAGFDQLDHMRQDPELDSLHDDERWDSLFEPVEEEEGEDRKSRALDFWVGEWDVYNREGGKAGTNRIELAVNKNLILENWTGASGRTGKSMTYLDPETGKWTQVWVGWHGNVLTLRGDVVEDGVLRFEGKNVHRDGRDPTLHRTTLTPREDGTVRQYIEESTDGETWEPMYDLLYVPTGEALPKGWREKPEPREVY